MKIGKEWLDNKYIKITRSEDFNEPGWDDIIEGSFRNNAPSFCFGCIRCHIRKEKDAINRVEFSEISCRNPCSRSHVDVRFLDYINLEKVELTMAIPDPVTMAKIVEGLKEHIKDGIIPSPLHGTGIHCDWNSGKSRDNSRTVSFLWEKNIQDTERDLSRERIGTTIHEEINGLSIDSVFVDEAGNILASEEVRLKAELEEVEKWAEQECFENNAKYS